MAITIQTRIDNTFQKTLRLHLQDN